MGPEGVTLTLLLNDSQTPGPHALLLNSRLIGTFAHSIIGGV